MDHTRYLAALEHGLRSLGEWQAMAGAAAEDETLALAPERVEELLDALVARLHENYPYGHPRYAGQMLKPPHALAALAYALAMEINPNNHAMDGGAATSRMEREAVAELATMFGYPQHLGHLTSGGTVANLEALFVARGLHPERAVAVSDQGHYTHTRMGALLGLPVVVVASDRRGRLDLDALERELATGRIGTVIATAGSTGLGAVDQVQEIVPLARRYGARVHVDAAYGGFFTLVARRTSPPVDPAPFLAIAESDSVVVDPHKHGLQPYGCGSVLFRDPSVGRFYLHDSPYTYFTSSDLHLGEISLECSRAGAAAAAFWTTLRAFPLAAEGGLGDVLAKCRAAALAWAELIRASERLRLVVEPELDIVNFYPLPAGQPTASAISALSDHVFARTEADRDDPVYLAKFVVQREQLPDAGITWDQPRMTVLRSVLMKPEHLAFVPRLHAAVERALED